jgi:hypothetical protein
MEQICGEAHRGTRCLIITNHLALTMFDQVLKAVGDEEAKKLLADLEAA